MNSVSNTKLTKKEKNFNTITIKYTKFKKYKRKKSMKLKSCKVKTFSIDTQQQTLLKMKNQKKKKLSNWSIKK